MSRRVVLSLCAVALGACRLDATMSISMSGNGSGLLRIDFVADQELIDRAKAYAGIDPIDDFRSGDLSAAGWTIEKADGGRRLTISHAFTDPAELTRLLESLESSAQNPVLRSFRARRDHRVFSDTYSVTGHIDLSSGGTSETWTDLLQGVNPDLVNTVAGSDLRKSFRLTMQVALPGRVETANAATGPALRWTVEPGQATDINVSTHELNVFSIATAVGAGALLVIVAMLSLAVARAARARRRAA